jgi:hypothetical protein
VWGDGSQVMSNKAIGFSIVCRWREGV